MNFFKNKKQKPPLPAPKPVPRTMDEINGVYRELVGRAGQLQYKVEVDKAQLRQLNDAIHTVNLEADERQKLDAEATAKANEPKLEVKNDGNK